MIWGITAFVSAWWGISALSETCALGHKWVEYETPSAFIKKRRYCKKCGRMEYKLYIADIWIKDGGSLIIDGKTGKSSSITRRR